MQPEYDPANPRGKDWRQVVRTANIEISDLPGGAALIWRRPATLGDLSWIEAQLPGLAQLLPTRYPLLPSSAETRAAIFDRLIEEHVVLVVESEGERAGFVVLLVAPHPLNPELLTAWEALWWIRPALASPVREHCALVLMDAAIEAAKRRGCRWIWWAGPLAEGATVPEGALRRRGFAERERQFLLEL